MTNRFQLHPDLERNGISVGAFPLCQVLLINDANYPWFVLIPKRSNVVELSDLSETDYDQLWQESRTFCAFLQTSLRPDKLNVATLGNMTPQLHVHHIARFRTDPAWPKPIWGAVALKPYEPHAVSKIREELSAAGMPGFSLA
ncbi:MAG: HIT domain-containing protein [Aureliella sp.]